MSSRNKGGIRVVGSTLLGDHHQVELSPYSPVHPGSSGRHLAGRGLGPRFRYGRDPFKRTAGFVSAHEKPERSAQGCGYALGVGREDAELCSYRSTWKLLKNCRLPAVPSNKLNGTRAGLRTTITKISSSHRCFCRVDCGSTSTISTHIADGRTIWPMRSQIPRPQWSC